MLKHASHAHLMRLATFASLGVATTLILAKAIAWWLSGSVSLLAGLTDSLLRHQFDKIVATDDKIKELLGDK